MCRDEVADVQREVRRRRSGDFERIEQGAWIGGVQKELRDVALTPSAREKGSAAESAALAGAVDDRRLHRHCSERNEQRGERRGLQKLSGFRRFARRFGRWFQSGCGV